MCSVQPCRCEQLGNDSGRACTTKERARRDEHQCLHSEDFESERKMRLRSKGESEHGKTMRVYTTPHGVNVKREGAIAPVLDRASANG